jgi:hypothetical protein
MSFSTCANRQSWRAKAQLKARFTFRAAWSKRRPIRHLRGERGSGRAARWRGPCSRSLCVPGASAALAADSLRQMGYGTTVIEGGLAGWKKADLPLRA